MQSVNFSFADKMMPEALYGDEILGVNKQAIKSFRKANSLFRPGDFSSICGLILVPSQLWAFTEHFEGDYFPHPRDLHHIQYHPKPFEEMMFVSPNCTGYIGQLYQPKCNRSNAHG
jgi:hypothetical protein